MPGAPKILPVLFVLAIPILLVTASVTWAINDLRLYAHGFDKFDIPAKTGIERPDLIQAAADIRGYFNSGQDKIDLRAPVFGQERSLFGGREVAHMKDVKDLIRGVYMLGAVAGLYLLSASLAGLLWKGGVFLPHLARWLLRGSVLTIGIIATVGLFALVAFDQLFLLFHKISFANDFWRLDPSRHYLVRMFPEGFWFDATLFVGIVSVGLALLLADASAAYLLALRHRSRSHPTPLLTHPERTTSS